MENFTPISAIFGGILIGLSAVWLMSSAGKIAGISGIVGGLFTSKQGDRFWRVSFVLGMMFSTLILGFIRPDLLDITFTLSGQNRLILLIVSGVLVGLGTQIGSGCTSGHGVCGNARLSLRSFIATIVFIITGMITVFLMAQFGRG